MAKNYDFKPDRPYSGFWDKLYITPLQRKVLLKWGLYAALLIFLSALQDVIFSRVDIFGATTDLVPCCIFLICVLEGVDNGCVFSLIAAVIYFFSGTGAGVYCIPFIVFPGVVITVFRQSYLQKGLGVAMLCTGVAMLVYELLTFGTGLFLEMTYLSRIGVFVLTAVLTLLTVPILYPLCRAIGKIGGEIWIE